MQAVTLKPYSWQQEALFDNAELYFEALISAISQAKQSIDLNFYIFNYDKTGRSIIAALAQAVKRKITVRVLIDGIGSYNSGLKAALELEKHGIEIRIFHPLPWQLSQYRRSAFEGNYFQKALHFFQKINHRDHRKLCIIDYKQLWTGSFNITDQHLSKANGGENWRDYGVMVCGANVAAISNNFDHFWQRSKTKQHPKTLPHHFQFYWHNFSHRSRKRKNHLLVKKINNAKQRIWIVSAYFAPSGRIIKALKLAAQRNIDVRVVVPRHSDVILFPYLANSYYHDLLSSGIRIYEYLPSFLHAKAMIIDEFYLLGSSNLNHRSSLHDLELDIILTQPSSQQQLSNFILSDIDQAFEIKRDDFKHSLIQKALGTIARMLRYWM
ncbi:phospholipase D-like domain-containing protein [Dasania sp. GY-MA-18]|uniref:Phospholipase D-like domain-containing protein n=1 Tax=Dasania phycosphaerae TaxID=2950436 RepID=A0A9J6RKG6_9GAMM|nr:MULTISPECIES: phospholipase D-like domain-containing protein [Dasania]MCR8922558.1 phospholipase D-like domain-containing protein [Dasania sp. GY-MA-18]MCZ0864987.1 phospholipase D-like domain-containing protein [Dasania phycosphaerae]MCZ0868714.1 phospholipase D-like domain-containing protein [Dasania phycosphaerae]